MRPRDYSRTAGNRCNPWASPRESRSGAPLSASFASRNIPTWIFFKPRIPHVHGGRSYHRLSFGTAHVTLEGRAPSRIDRDALHPPVFRGGRQSVGTDDRSASSSGSMTRPTSESPTLTSIPSVSLTERRRAERSNGEIRSRRTSHKSSISCYRRDTAQLQ